MLSIPQQGERTMSEVTKDQMLMRADDIEDILNDVFARHMPELHEQEECRTKKNQTKGRN